MKQQKHKNTKSIFLLWDANPKAEFLKSAPENWQDEVHEYGTFPREVTEPSILTNMQNKTKKP